jgi:hypothetical protein
MILTPTALVLGAGASSHLNFPLGRALKNQVCDTLRQCGHSDEEVVGFAEALRGSHQPSIEFFVEPDAHATLRPLAREAIAAALIPRENLQMLQRHPGWYEYLFNRIGSRLEHFEKSRISIITFNYDRSIDTFLFEALKHHARTGSGAAGPPWPLDVHATPGRTGLRLRRSHAVRQAIQWRRVSASGVHSHGQDRAGTHRRR